MKKTRGLFLIFGFLLIGGFLVLAESPQKTLWQNFLDFLTKNLSLASQKKLEIKDQTSFLNPTPAVVDLETTIVNIAEKSSPAVVSIVISKYVPILEKYYIDPFQDLPPELRPFFEFKIPQLREKGKRKQKVGGGTGFIVSADGLIVTNKHVVIDPEAEYTVYLNDGRKFKAKVLARHPVDDLAILKIDANNLPTLTLGDTTKLKLGQFVIAIGNALGEFQNTVSFGVISGLNRTITASDEEGRIERLEGLIQTDAAINFGNSGGPLLNLRGEVIGVNTAIASGAENIGFAIPVERVKRMLSEVQTKGKIEVPFLGIYYLLINDEVQKKFNLPVNYGAFIYRQGKSAIITNSPAERAGLKDQDIILEIDGEKITTQNGLGQIILKKEVGQRVNLKVLRENQILNISVILGSLPENLPDR